MSVLSRVAHYDVLHIMPKIRVLLHRLMLQLQNSVEYGNTIGSGSGSGPSNPKGARGGAGGGGGGAEKKSTTVAINLNQQDIVFRLESVQLLQALVRGANTLIAPYVDQILEALVPLLTDPSSSIARSALSTIGELSVASPESITDLLDDLFPMLIRSLQDGKSVENQEVAVEAMGKLVSSLTMVTEEPYTRYPGLFDGLVGIIQSNMTSTDLRLKAIQTAGLLGAVDVAVYNTQLKSYKARLGKAADVGTDEEEVTGRDNMMHARKNNNNANGNHYNNNNHGRYGQKGDNIRLGRAGAAGKAGGYGNGQGGHGRGVDYIVQDEEDVQMRTSKELELYLEVTKEPRMTNNERFYFSVVMRNLIKILKDSSLTQAHQSACQIAMKILKMVGPQAQPVVGGLLDAVTFRLYNTEPGNNLRLALLDHLVTMIHIMGNLMSPHIPDIVRLIQAFFISHLPACMDLVESLALKLSFPDFNTVLREVLPTILQVLHEERFDPDSGLDSQATLNSRGINFSTALLGGSTFFGSSSSSSLTLTRSQEEQQGISSGIASNPRGNRGGGGALHNQGSNNLDSSGISKNTILPKTTVILQSCINLSDILGDHHKRTVVPSILRVLDFQGSVYADVRKQALSAAMYLTNDGMLHEYANQLILPLMRILSEPENSSDSKTGVASSLRLRSAAVVALSCLCCRLGTSYIPYIIPVRRNLNNLVVTLRQSRGDSAAVTLLVNQLAEYENLVFRLLEHKPLPMEPTDAQSICVEVSERLRVRSQTARTAPERYLPPSLSTLEQAWALASRKKSSDLTEWMSRLSNELIRQSPSPVIRACASLSKTYKPLAEELFTVCFVCIWDDLFLEESDELVDSNSLIDSIQSALDSDQIPASMMASLLELTEFMDMQDKRLPLNVPMLAKHAQGANMYAKSLRYRELEFGSKNQQPDDSCIESLISVNNQLGVEDRAEGVLEYVMMEYPKKTVEPRWSEKLKRWDEAKEMYAERNEGYRESYPTSSAVKIPAWLHSRMGMLRCMNALGEFPQLASEAVEFHEELMRVSIEPDVGIATEVRRLGASATWMLGQWDRMGSLLSHQADGEDEVRLSASGTTVSGAGAVDMTNNISFYRTVLAIQKEEYAQALDLIDQTRGRLASTIASLLSEGYSRAYRAMVTMQILSELEEVIEYKQSVAVMVQGYAQDDRKGEQGDFHSRMPGRNDSRIHLQPPAAAAAADNGSNGGGTGMGSPGSGNPGSVHSSPSKAFLDSSQHSQHSQRDDRDSATYGVSGGRTPTSPSAIGGSHSRREGDRDTGSSSNNNNDMNGGYSHAQQRVQVRTFEGVLEDLYKYQSYGAIALYWCSVSYFMWTGALES